jgi:MoxR-like ATPase
MRVEEVAGHARPILDEVERVVIGKREALELVLMGMLADGHVLIDDYPGLAKTLIARSFAQVTEMRFTRIQFTPDLMPADVTGSSIYNQRTSDFEFRPGPIFTNLLLADEINRTPPKTQAALLEAMQERQVTVEGETRPLAPPFLVLATQNPIEYEGTYPLPEAQLDRFLLRLSIGYPGRLDEVKVLDRRIERRSDETKLEPIIDAAGLLEMQRAIEDVHVSEPIQLYIVDLARCRAALAGRDFVTPEDVKAVAVPALAHRISLRPELWVQQISGEDVVREILETVPTPPAETAEAGR